MLRESFAPQLLRQTTRWLEAPWKMLLSNKAILPVLYKLFPDSPYLLKASFDPLPGQHVRKPMFGREGANIASAIGGQVISETPGPYGRPFVYQESADIPRFGGVFPVIGSWMVNGYACGIGIREDRLPSRKTPAGSCPMYLLDWQQSRRAEGGRERAKRDMHRRNKESPPEGSGSV